MARRTSTGFDKTHYGNPVGSKVNGTKNFEEPGRAKGVEGQKCNVTACTRRAPATYFNFSTNKFYCVECAFDINRANPEFEREKGFPLLCKVPQASDDDDCHEWENCGLIRSTGFKELFSKELKDPVAQDFSSTTLKVSALGSSVKYAHAKVHKPEKYIKNAKNNIFVGFGRGNHAQRDVSWTAIEVLYLTGYDQHLVLEIQRPDHPNRVEHFALTPGVVYEFNATTKHRFLTQYPNTMWSIATCYVDTTFPISVK